MGIDDLRIPPLPGNFVNPDEFLQKGYDKAAKGIQLKELVDDPNFKLWLETVELRWLTLRSLALSDVIAPEKRERYRSGANELERQLNTLYSAIGKANEINDPQSLLNKEIKQKIKDIEEYQRMQRRP